MPFTPSHIAAVLPLRHVGPALPLAALAAGSISPDLPYFLPGLTALGVWTHRPLAVVSLDVILGLIAWIVWRSIAVPLHQLSPASIRERWRPVGWRSSPWWAVLLSIAIGAATHIGWDSFTHAGRFASSHLAFLTASYPSPIGVLAGYQYAQYASGVFGLAVIAWVGLRRPRVPTPPRPPTALATVLPWGCAIAAVIGADSRVLHSGAVEDGSGAVIFAAITGAMSAAAVVAMIVCWVHVWRTRIAAPAPTEPVTHSAEPPSR
jgi:hypothetical protein